VTPLDRVLALPIWAGEVEAAPSGGGITNVNFVVQDGNRRVVVRVGDDIPVHQVLRFYEVAASRAAERAGLSPRVLYHQPGVLVIDHINCATMTAADLFRDALLDQSLDLVARAHRDMPHYLRGPVRMFWVFHVIRDYAATLYEGHIPYAPLLPAVLRDAAGGGGGAD